MRRVFGWWSSVRFMLLHAVATLAGKFSHQKSFLMFSHLWYVAVKTIEKVWLSLRGNNELDQLRRLQQWDCSLVSMEHIRQSYFLPFLVSKKTVDCAYGVC